MGNLNDGDIRRQPTCRLFVVRPWLAPPIAASVGGVDNRLAVRRRADYVAVVELAAVETADAAARSRALW